MSPPDVMELGSTWTHFSTPTQKRRRVTFRTTPSSLASSVGYRAVYSALSQARGWESFSKAKGAFLALGTDAVPSILETLREPVPVQTRDVLVQFLVQHPNLNAFREQALNPGQSVWQRVALAEVLTESACGGGDQLVRVVLATLRDMTHHPEGSVLLAAVQGIARLASVSKDAREALAALATEERAPVRNAAADALGDLEE